jgi:hypothetical protein
MPGAVGQLDSSHTFDTARNFFDPINKEKTDAISAFSPKIEGWIDGEVRDPQDIEGRPAKEGNTDGRGVAGAGEKALRRSGWQTDPHSIVVFEDYRDVCLFDRLLDPFNKQGLARIEKKQRFDRGAHLR